ncbi:MAG TPA: RNA helicase, partial [Cupriavidus sp.]|nr:RNA helicase [Cupriavidus sp.]
GRTGRAGRSGVAINLVNHGDMFQWRRIERFTNNRIDASVIEGFEPRRSPKPRSNFGGKPGGRDGFRGNGGTGGGYRGNNGGGYRGNREGNGDRNFGERRFSSDNRGFGDRAPRPFGDDNRGGFGDRGERGFGDRSNGNSNGGYRGQGQGQGQ